MSMKTSNVSRRSFLAGGTAAAALAAGRTFAAEDGAEGSTEVEKANEAVVMKMCEEIAHVDAERLAPLVSDDVVFQLIDGQPLVEGKEAFLQGGRDFFQAFERAEFVVHRSHVIGNLVLNERDDHFYPKGGGDRTTFKVSGFFVVKNGKITEWRDYALPS